MPQNSKTFILPLIFYKRLSDVFDDEVADLIGGDTVAMRKKRGKMIDD